MGASALSCRVIVFFFFFLPVYGICRFRYFPFLLFLLHPTRTQYPIRVTHRASFIKYVREFYIEGFGLDPEKCLLIDATNVGLKYVRQAVPKRG